MEISNKERQILGDVLMELRSTGVFPQTSQFRVKHETVRRQIDRLTEGDLLRNDSGRLQLTIMGLWEVESDISREILGNCENLIPILRAAYRSEPDSEWSVTRLCERSGMDSEDLAEGLFFLKELNIWSGFSQDLHAGRGISVQMKEAVLDLTSLDKELLARKTRILQSKAKSDPAKATKSKTGLNVNSRNFSDRWKMVKTLGEGGQAHTFVVTDEDAKDGVFYALKRLKNLKRLPRFKSEIEAISSLNHVNVIKIIDHQLDIERPFFVSEYCAAGSLANKTFAFDRALRIFQDCCKGLAATHEKGITHRDIKPENILLRGPEGEAVVADFGLCFIDEGERHTIVDEAVGPRLFIAPELEDGRADSIESSSDVYSLGKLLYWLLTGGQLFSREKHRETKFNLVTLLGPEFEHVNRMLDKMVVLDPSRRLPSASAVLVEIKEVERLILGRYNVIGPGIVQMCMYCGTGAYEVKVTGNGASAHNFGIQAAGSADQRILACNACGHVQLFRIDLAERKEWWG